MVGGHQRSGSVQPVIRPQGDRIGNHPVLASFDRSDGRGLRFDVQILVNDADSALLGQGDGQWGLRHGVHGGGQQRDPDANPPGEAGFGTCSIRCDV